jgi:PKD repeat protein
MNRYNKQASIVSILLLALVVLMAGCNLTGTSDAPIETAQAQLVTASPLPTRTSLTALIPTQIASVPTQQSINLPPTAQLPVNLSPTLTSSPISIVILSPIPGNVVAGNVQILGAAIHPQFLQYQLEYGPDPNPGNLWYPASGMVQSPVLNGLLGIWGTTGTPDGVYQLRLRLTLRDGTNLVTVVNGVRVQNQAPTPVPTNTPNIPRPVAAFTQDRTIGQAPLVIQFQNLSSGNITSFEWNFGDGTTSRDVNPVHSFQSPGIYNVTLTVSGPGGSTNVTQQINAQAASAPVAAFSATPETGVLPLRVTFTNGTTGTVSRYLWDLGDGTTSNNANVVHEYSRAGTYNVILTVTGPGGTSTTTRQIRVNDPAPLPPTAAFTTSSTSGTVPLSVQFVNQSTGSISAYLWTFGDGGTSTDANPTYIYRTPGTYAVSLQITGPGGTASTQSSIQVNQAPQAPVAAFLPSVTTGTSPLSVSFQNTSTGQFTTTQWQFGDGGTSTETSPTYVFQRQGDFTVVLTVTGPGGTSTAQAVISARLPQAPVASFVTTPSQGTTPLTVVFDASSSSGEITGYAWDFGDGSTSNLASPTYIYNRSGVFTVTLRVTGPGGESAPFTNTVTVSDVIAQPVASFVSSPSEGPAPLTVQFDSAASSGDITGYAWDFGDQVGFSTEANPSYIYSVAGDYTVSLTVSGPGGSSTPFTTIVRVIAPAVAPIASFVSNPSEGPAPLTVQFDSSASSGDITGYAWDFGDQVGFSTEANPSYIYSVAGDYTVSLTVSGPGGSSTPFITTIRVADVPPPPTNSIDRSILFTRESSGQQVLNVLQPDGVVEPIGDAFGNNREPAWSSDGTRIALVTDRDGNNEIYVMNADGSGAFNLTNAPDSAESAPAWSPDGSRIAFVTDRDGNDEIYVMNADGSGAFNLTNAPDSAESAPAWSPDRTRIAFVTDRDGNDEIYVMNADGSGAFNLSNTGSNEAFPAWSPDGSKLVFLADGNGLWQIALMNADGSNGIILLSDPVLLFKTSIAPN